MTINNTNNHLIVLFADLNINTINITNIIQPAAILTVHLHDASVADAIRIKNDPQNDEPK